MITVLDPSPGAAAGGKYGLSWENLSFSHLKIFCFNFTFKSAVFLRRKVSFTKVVDFGFSDLPAEDSGSLSFLE